MRIIRPYGHSKTQINETHTSERVLIQDSQTQHLSTFATEHPELVIAQWISALDKIATKPNPNAQNKHKRRATVTQFDLRETLGHAAWRHITSKLPSGETRLIIPDGKHDYYRALWNNKIHPYGTKRPYPPRQPDKDKLNAEQWQKAEDAAKKRLATEREAAKGRWYDVFVHNLAPHKVDAAKAADIIQRIDDHLYRQEQRRAGSPLTKGKIALRAHSIANNVLKPARATQTWKQSDEQLYTDAGDVATQIYNEAEKARRLFPDLAGKHLFKHWADVFGEGVNFKQAEQEKPGLLALHLAVKDTYRRILKERSKPKLHHLPHDMNALLHMVALKQQNRDLNHLIRQGKILHYQENSDPTLPQTHTQAENYFWSSDGQAEIKRAEAFVRIWRQAIGQANLSLSNWASMAKGEFGQDFGGDILGSRGVFQEIIGSKNFDAVQFDQRARLLFGDAATFWTGDDARRKATLQSAIVAWNAIRNAAFHFKTLDTFVSALTQLPQTDNFAQDELGADLNHFWDESWQEREARFLATLEGVHLHYFFGQQHINAFIEALTHAPETRLPLPRFGRVLLRYANTHKATDNTRQSGNTLPPPANRTDLEQAARKCQYVSLKLLYERAFRAWLLTRSADDIDGWMNTAIQRTKTAAQNINAGRDQEKRLIVTAKADKLRFSEAEQASLDIRAFFHKLSAETAADMRVQNGYQSDGDNAREQSAYIDDLLCDVMALAFLAFVKAKKLDWLLTMPDDTPLPQHPVCPFPNKAAAQPPAYQDWQPTLYFLLHLVPVGDVSSLLHQLMKWEITAGRVEDLSAAVKTRLSALQQTLGLYLDRHDAQFNQFNGKGNSKALWLQPDELRDFASLYENDAAFTAVFPDQSGDTAGTALNVPQRELRELRRFGHLPVLRALMGNHRISVATVTACLQDEAVSENHEECPDGKSAIERAQQAREKLHSDWVKQRKGFKQYRAYAEQLRIIVQHRQQANHIRLVEHTRAHRLVLQVLARLVDYAGLFERDLYFTCLALMHAQRCQVNDCFTESGASQFSNGQIISALRQCTPQGETVLADLSRYFPGFQPDAQNALVQTRNALAHFNMLQGLTDTADVTLNLTDWVNNTRQLMAYDRKLKNAVSKSIKDLLVREGFQLTWRMQNHQLVDASVTARTARHLGKQSFEACSETQKNSKPKRVKLEEALHSQAAVSMIARVFGGTAVQAQDVTTLAFDTLKWETGKNGHQQGGNRGRTGRNSGKKTPEKPSLTNT